MYNSISIPLVELTVIKDVVQTVNADDVDEYAQFVTYRVSQLNAKLTSEATRLLRLHCGLSIVQWRILALVCASAPITSAALVKAVAMDAGLFSRNLKSLIADGLILSHTDPNDNRQQVLRLSKRGITQYKRAQPFMKARRDRLTKGISAEDLESFFHVLDAIERNIAEHKS